MKLNEIKNLLADSIETYSTTVRKEIDGNLYDVQYELNVSKQDATKRFITVLFGGDRIYDALKELEVKTIYCGSNGFIIELDVSDPELFEKLATENHIPLTTTKYVVID